MAIITMLVIVVFVAILVVNFTVQQRSNYEPEVINCTLISISILKGNIKSIFWQLQNKKMQEYVINKDKAVNEITINVPALDQSLGQPSSEHGVLETHNPPDLPSETLEKLPDNLAIEV
ncbi:hypothetical protein L1049_022755 [Liquidambar formosana]|uniref:Uncharacterized protein n=1 Tax=Liquidambar formosana TaxID=63359 RepID=A0AAP0RF11_LIQFO